MSLAQMHAYSSSATQNASKVYTAALVVTQDVPFKASILPTPRLLKIAIIPNPT